VRTVVSREECRKRRSHLDVVDALPALGSVLRPTGDATVMRVLAANDTQMESHCSQLVYPHSPPVVTSLPRSRNGRDGAYLNNRARSISND